MAVLACLMLATEPSLLQGLCLAGVGLQLGNYGWNLRSVNMKPATTIQTLSETLRPARTPSPLEPSSSQQNIVKGTLAATAPKQGSYD